MINDFFIKNPFSRFIEIRGVDSAEFLQGIITNDIYKCKKMRPIYSCLLSPQGKFLADFFIIALSDSYLIEIHEKFFASFLSYIKIYKLRLNKTNINKIIHSYDNIIDASDNFKTKFLLNDFCFKYKKFLITGAISKFDGHIFSFDFKNKKFPCLRCFFQETTPSDDFLNCEAEGILGTVASTVGSLQANEILKKILTIGTNLNGYILILNLLTLSFRKAKISKKKNCFCNK